VNQGTPTTDTPANTNEIAQELCLPAAQGTRFGEMLTRANSMAGGSLLYVLKVVTLSLLERVVAAPKLAKSRHGPRHSK
jgi:hypothetical protein